MSEEFNMHVTQIIARKYIRASKKEKTIMLDDYCRVSKVSRNLASKRYLRASRDIYPLALKVERKLSKRGPKVKYTSTHKAVIKKVWNLYGNICAERLYPKIKEGIRELGNAGELRGYSKEELTLCGNVSLGTLKNVLLKFPKPKGYRKRNRKPGIYSRVPIEANFNRYANHPGYVEVDPVEHTGGNKSGKYAITGCYVCIFSQWIARSADLGQTLASIEAIHDRNVSRFYHKIKKYHCDNARAVLRVLFKKACDVAVTYKDQKETMNLSRSRAYKKEDNGHVEQKNGDKVRKLVGYHRYDTKRQISLLNKFYLIEDLITNFFIPSQKLKRKYYDDNGRVVRKKYDKATTPYERLMRSKQVDNETKIKLKDTYDRLSLVWLRKESERIQEELFRTVSRK